jgi:hypothetical protein
MFSTRAVHDDGWRISLPLTKKKKKTNRTAEQNFPSEIDSGRTENSRPLINKPISMEQVVAHQRQNGRYFPLADGPYPSGTHHIYSGAIEPSIILWKS